MQAVVLTAGDSKRFWPLSEKHRKALFKIMGRSLLEWTLLELEETGFKKVVVVQGPEKGAEKELRGKTFKFDLQFVVQKEAKGMGDAMMQAEPLIDGDFFLLNTNHFTCGSLVKQMLEKQKETGAKAVFVGTRTVNVFKRGFLKLAGDKATEMIEVPPEGIAPSDIMIRGIYLVPKEIFSYHRKVPEREYSWEDALNLLIHEKDCRAILTDEQLPSLKYTWDMLTCTKLLMDYRLKGQRISETTKIEAGAKIIGDVWIGAGTRVYEDAVIKGPCFIGESCVIGNHTLIRDYTNIEDNCLIGAKSEITNCIFQEGCHTHHGYFGTSIFGKNSMMGSGFTTANRRIDRGEIKSTVRGVRVPTGLSFFGCVLAHNVKVGIGVNIMPGVLVGCNTVIGPMTLVKENIDSYTTYYTEFQGIAKKRIPQEKKFDAVVFDADGTLYKIHAERAYKGLFQALSKSTGFPEALIEGTWKTVVSELNDSKDPEKRRREHALKLTLEKLGAKVNGETVEKGLEQFWRQVGADLEVEKGAETVLDSLADSCEICIASDEFLPELKKKISAAFSSRVFHMFETIITPEKTGAMKPSPEYIKAVLSALNAEPSRVLVVGNSWERDLKDAKAFGVRTVLLGTSKEGNPDFWIRSLHELPALIGGAE